MAYLLEYHADIDYALTLQSKRACKVRGLRDILGPEPCTLCQTGWSQVHLQKDSTSGAIQYVAWIMQLVMERDSLPDTNAMMQEWMLGCLVGLEDALPSFFHRPKLA